VINLVVALASEARPLVRHFRMSQDRSSTSFRVYTADHIRLVVTGVGKVNSAAGVAYLGGLDNRPDQVWLNVGLAGHHSLAVGTGIIALKITDQGDSRSRYPPRIADLPGIGSHVMTFDKPVEDYPASTVCDMEASAFYGIAIRFGTSELVQCYKVISDNKSTGVSTVESSMAEGLISAKLREIDELSSILDGLACAVSVHSPAEKPYGQFVEQWHFSATQRGQLREALRRLAVRGPGDILRVANWRHCKTAKSLLQEMSDYLDSLPVRL